MRPEDWVELMKRNSSQIIIDEMENMPPETENPTDDPTRPIPEMVFHVKHSEEMNKTDKTDETDETDIPDESNNLNPMIGRNLLFHLFNKVFIAFQIILWVPVTIAVIAAMSVWLFGGALLILRELGFDTLVTSILEYFPLTML